jgi:hypothetical protein
VSNFVPIKNGIAVCTDYNQHANHKKSLGKKKENMDDRADGMIALAGTLLHERLV